MSMPDDPKVDDDDEKNRPQRPHPNESENQPGFDPGGERRQADHEPHEERTAPSRGDRFERRKKQWEGGDP